MTIGLGYVARGALAGEEMVRQRELEAAEEERRQNEERRRQEEHDYIMRSRLPPEEVQAGARAKGEREAAAEARTVETHRQQMEKGKQAIEKSKHEAASRLPPEEVQAGARAGIEQEKAAARTATAEAGIAETKAAGAEAALSTEQQMADLGLRAKQIEVENLEYAQEIAKVVRETGEEAASLEAFKKVQQLEFEIMSNFYHLWKISPQEFIRQYNASPISSAQDAAGVEEYKDARGLPRIKLVDAQGNTVTDKRGGEQDFSLVELETAFNSSEWSALPGGGGLFQKKTGETKAVPREARKGGTVPAIIQEAEWVYDNIKGNPEFEGVPEETIRFEAYKIAARTSSKDPKEQRANFFKAIFQTLGKDATPGAEQKRAKAYADQITDEYFPQAGATGIEAPTQGTRAPTTPPPAGFVLQ